MLRNSITIETEKKEERKRALTTFSFPVSLYFALSLLSTQSTEGSPAVIVHLLSWLSIILRDSKLYKNVECIIKLKIVKNAPPCMLQMHQPLLAKQVYSTAVPFH